MKKCLMIPGVDALENPQHRKHLLEFQEVRENLEKAQAILDERGIRSDLNAFMQAPNEASADWFRHLALSTPAVHLALYDRYVAENGRPDLILSCSLGDISRNVCA